MDNTKDHIWLHIIVFIFGSTGVLGKLITLPSDLLVWYRVFIASFALGIFLVFTKVSFRIMRKDLLNLFLIGGIVALHWITFFESIKQSNVSVALACFSTTTLFTSLLEPIYFKRKLRTYEVMLGVMIIAGISIIFSVQFHFIVGMALSIFSAFLASWFTVLNARIVKRVKAKVMSFYELLSAFIIISPYLIFSGNTPWNSVPVPADWIWLLLLGIVCTAFAFLMSIHIMRSLPPFTVSIAINLEPIYAMVLAAWIWPDSEIMDAGFYIGAVIVLSAIFLNGVFKRRQLKRQVTT